MPTVQISGRPAGVAVVRVALGRGVPTVDGVRLDAQHLAVEARRVGGLEGAGATVTGPHVEVAVRPEGQRAAESGSSLTLTPETAASGEGPAGLGWWAVRFRGRTGPNGAELTATLPTGSPGRARPGRRVPSPPLAQPVVLDVTEFGAVGDGVTNDGTAVLAHTCFEGFDGFRTIRPRFDPEVGATLYLPAGTYRLGPIDGYDRNHSFPFSRFHIRGDGPGRTVVLLDHVAYPKVRLSIHGDARFGGGLDTSSSDLTIASNPPDPGNRTSADMNVHLRDLRGFRAEWVGVCNGPRIGFHVDSCTGVTLRDVHVHDICTDGIHLIGCHDVLVEDCSCADTGDDAIAVWGGNWWNPDQSTDVVVRRNRIERAGSNGIALAGCDRVVVEDNTVRGTYLSGIGIRPMAEFGPVSGVTISGNRNDDAGFHETGILWGGGIASGIAVADDMGTGVALRGLRVVHNVLGRCRNNLVRLRGAHDVRIVENELRGPLVPGPAPTRGPARAAPTSTLGATSRSSSRRATAWPSSATPRGGVAPPAARALTRPVPDL